MEKYENGFIEKVAMELISSAGMARSLAMDSIRFARKGEFEKAQELLKQSDKAILEGHNVHTELLTAEANQKNIEFTVLLVHSLEHLMNAMTVRELAEEFVNIYENGNGQNPIE